LIVHNFISHATEQQLCWMPTSMAIIPQRTCRWHGDKISWIIKLSVPQKSPGFPQYLCIKQGNRKCSGRIISIKCTNINNTISSNYRVYYNIPCYLPVTPNALGSVTAWIQQKNWTGFALPEMDEHYCHYYLHAIDCTDEYVCVFVQCKLLPI
jgi:hypothetical protein